MRSVRSFVLLAFLVGPVASLTAFHHFELRRSDPAPKAVLKTVPARLQLWFSEVPAAGVSQLKLSGESGDLALGKTVISSKDKSMYADPAKPLTPGRYTIHWRGAGDDGHVLAGDIAFSVAAK